MHRFIAGLLLLLVMGLSANGAHAQVTLTQTPLSDRYEPGGTLDIQVTIDVVTAIQINGVGVEQTLPTGWSYNSTVSGELPSILPNVGATGLIDFAWFPLPETYPVSFVYRVDIASDATGTKTLAGNAIVLLDGVGEVRASQGTIIPKLGTGPFHTADIDLSGTVSLSEVLRIIQFYNIGGLHCADFPTDTEDGYVPGAAGPKACDPHNSDYNPQDWTISLSELLRVIQFYNSFGYYYCPAVGSEDTYCPGIEP